MGIARESLVLALATTATACCLINRASDEHTVSRETRHGGLAREFQLHVPPNLPQDKPAPLVFVLHGGGGSGRQIERFTGFSSLSDQQGFIAVYPDAIDRNWNDGRAAENIPSQKQNIDDVGFLSAIIDALSQEFRIDPKRIYCTGISNGGFMSERLAADLSDRIAAIAPVASGMAPELAERFKPSAPVSVLILNGTEDPLVPYHGGPVARDRGRTIDTNEIVKKWVERNHCLQPAKNEELADRDPDDGCRVRRAIYAGRADVILYRIDGGGHTWPGGSQYLPQRYIGRVCRDFDATALIWEFFLEHPKE